MGLIVKIDKKLNLVTNITREDGSIVYLHVTPFPYEVVEEHCLLLGNLFTNFISQVGGLGAARVAAMMLRKKLQREQEQAELRSVWQEASTLRTSAERMAQEALSDPAKVEAAPEKAFAAGELDLLARLDGVRSLLDAELAALEQTQRARKACIALDRLLGKVNP